MNWRVLLPTDVCQQFSHWRGGVMLTFACAMLIQKRFRFVSFSIASSSSWLFDDVSIFTFDWSFQPRTAVNLIGFAVCLLSMNSVGTWKQCYDQFIVILIRKFEWTSSHNKDCHQNMLRSFLLACENNKIGTKESRIRNKTKHQQSLFIHFFRMDWVGYGFVKSIYMSKRQLCGGQVKITLKLFAWITQHFHSCFDLCIFFLIFSIAHNRHSNQLAEYNDGTEYTHTHTQTHTLISRW